MFKLIDNKEIAEIHRLDCIILAQENVLIQQLFKLINLSAEKFYLENELRKAKELKKIKEPKVIKLIPNFNKY